MSSPAWDPYSADFPKQPNAESIRTQADLIASKTKKIDSTVGNIKSDWAGMTAVYKTPDQETVYTAVNPVKTTSGELEDSGTKVKGALDTYADWADDFKSRKSALMERYYDIKGKIEDGGDDWNKDQDLVNDDTTLLHDADALAADHMAAERTCANAIEALFGGIVYVETSQDGPGSGETEYGFSTDQLDAAAAEGHIPWGEPNEWDKPWYKDAWDGVVSFGKGVWSGVTGTVTGLWNMVNFTDGETFAATWKGIGTLALDVAIVTNPAVAEIIGGPGTVKKSGERLITVGKAAVHWDEWKEDPAYAAGQTTFDLATILFTAGGGAVAKTGSVASKISKVSKGSGLASKTVNISGLAKLSNITLKGIDLKDLGKLKLKNYAIDLKDIVVDVTKGPNPKTVVTVDPHGLKIPQEHPGATPAAATKADGANASTAVDTKDAAPVAARGDGTDVPEGSGSKSGADVPEGSGSKSGADVPEGSGSKSGADVPEGSKSGADVPEGSKSGADAQEGSKSGADAPEGSKPGADVSEGSGSKSGADAPEGSKPGADVSEGSGSKSGADAQEGSKSGADVSEGSGSKSEGSGGTPGADAHRFPRDIERGERQSDHIENPEQHETYGQHRDSPEVQDRPLEGWARHPDKVNADLDGIYDPDQPRFGVDEHGNPLTEHEYANRYGHSDANAGGINYPDNAGAAEGSFHHYKSLADFRADFGDVSLDRIGANGGKYLSIEGTPWHMRGLPVDTLGKELHHFSLDDLPGNFKIEVSEIAPAFGRPGGGTQILLREMDLNGKLLPDAVSVDELVRRGALRETGPHAFDAPWARNLDAPIDLSTRFDLSVKRNTSVLDALAANGGKLDPLTVYDFPGRGQFYTNSAGNVQHISAASGQKGAWNPELNNPRPNVTYHVDDNIVVRTNAAGLPAEMHAHDLKLLDHDDANLRRHGTNQASAGSMGGDGYDGGHLLAAMFGGPGEKINLFPQVSLQNRNLGLGDLNPLQHRRLTGAQKTWYDTELWVRQQLSDLPPGTEPKITWHARAIHDAGGDSPIPNRMDLEVTVGDGSPQFFSFSNELPGSRS